MDIEITGTILLEDNEIDHDKFLDIFIEFIEKNNWRFVGVTRPIGEIQFINDEEEKK